MLIITKDYHAILTSYFLGYPLSCNITKELNKPSDTSIVPNNYSEEKEVFSSLVKKSAKSSHYKILPPYGTGLHNIYS